MNESDAKKCWCPFAHAAAERIGGRTFIPANAMCLGSACMAWRAYDDESGYCGLAGAPMNSNQGERT